ncbi:MAG: DNA polymerase II, partial [Nitrospirae bacterium]
RDGREPKIRRSRFSIAERNIDYSRMDVFGRHIVDTYFLLLHHDLTAREMENYGLKSAAIHFGISLNDRTYVERRHIKWYIENDPEMLKRYNLDDAKETLLLSELLSYPFFLQSRIFPYSYQNIFVRGNATKINSLFIREYLRRRASIPKPKGKGVVEGGYTDVFKRGVIENVMHCDVASLYPSIMLAFNIKPSGDHLDVFLNLLKTLKDFRIKVKKLSKMESNPKRKDYLEALQQTFKILINSFYGYLGTEIHHFSDPEAASEVTKIGRELIRKMIEWLKKHGAEPIEIDTDGIYFVPPNYVKTWEDAEELALRLSNILPKGIEVEIDGWYRAMLSYKKKNYALLDESGKLIIRGSALRSRGMERYLRDFLIEMLTLMLSGRSKEVRALYEDYIRKIERHELDISKLARTETLTESPESYLQKVRKKKRNPSASYELALSSGRNYRAGDQISYYVTGSSRNIRLYENCKLLSEYDDSIKNENVAYYKWRLKELF